MVLTETLSVTWCPSNKKHLEELGYKFTKYKDKITVKFEDISHSSDLFIDIKCDYCGNIFEKSIKKYYKGREIINKDCCSNCRIEKTKEARLKKYGTMEPLYNDALKNKWLKTQNNKIANAFKKMQKEFKAKDLIMLPTIYVNNHTPIPYICNKHMGNGIQYIDWSHLRREGCYYCGREKFIGENNPRWNGGTSEINYFLRSSIYKWVNDSLKHNNYKCDITGLESNLVVHHMYKNFKDIALETLDELNLEVKHNIGRYTKEERNLLVCKCNELHYKYGLGVCLNDDIHRRFHQEYGVYNNTKEQYEEFKNKLKKEYEKQCKTTRVVIANSGLNLSL